MKAEKVPWSSGLNRPRDLEEKLDLLRGSSVRDQGFVLQEFIDHGGRDLRVVILYDQLFAYWRVQPDPSQFRTNQRQGGEIDPEGDPKLKNEAIKAVEGFCRRAGINVAGLDILFNRTRNPDTPLFLEINYYFGRRGLGGSLRFYELFEQAADRWLADGEPEEKPGFNTKIASSNPPRIRPLSKGDFNTLLRNTGGGGDFYASLGTRPGRLGVSYENRFLYSP